MTTCPRRTHCVSAHLCRRQHQTSSHPGLTLWFNYWPLPFQSSGLLVASQLQSYWNSTSMISETGWVGLPTATVPPESFLWGHGLFAGLPLAVSFLQIWPMYIRLSSLRCSSKQVTSARSFHKPPLPSELHTNSSL